MLVLERPPRRRSCPTSGRAATSSRHSSGSSRAKKEGKTRSTVVELQSLLRVPDEPFYCRGPKLGECFAAKPDSRLATVQRGPNRRGACLHGMHHAGHVRRHRSV